MPPAHRPTGQEPRLGDVQHLALHRPHRTQRGLLRLERFFNNLLCVVEPRPHRRLLLLGHVLEPGQHRLHLAARAQIRDAPRLQRSTIAHARQPGQRFVLQFTNRFQREHPEV